ncbi:hypothetical protein ACFLQW_02910 [Candidatus Zixiibacteriota bacterium]
MMRQKRFVLPILLVFVFALSLSFSASMQEVEAAGQCGELPCIAYCMCQYSWWEGKMEPTGCNIYTDCWGGSCTAEPCQ